MDDPGFVQLLQQNIHFLGILNLGSEDFLNLCFTAQRVTRQVLHDSERTQLLLGSNA